MVTGYPVLSADVALGQPSTLTADVPRSPLACRGASPVAAPRFDTVHADANWRVLLGGWQDGSRDVEVVCGGLLAHCGCTGNNAASLNELTYPLPATAYVVMAIP